jgi:hypothetical protein
LDYVFLNVLEKIVEKRGKTRENRIFGLASSSFGRCVAEKSVKYNPPRFGQTTIPYPENLQSLASCYCENSPRLLGFVPPAYKPRCTHKKVTLPRAAKCQNSSINSCHQNDTIDVAFPRVIEKWDKFFAKEHIYKEFLSKNQIQWPPPAVPDCK